MINVVQSAPAEIAQRLVDNWVPRHLIAIDRQKFTEAIRRALVDICASELTKRWELERILEGCNLAGVMVVCTETGTSLRVWNPKRREYATVTMIEGLEGGDAGR